MAEFVDFEELRKRGAEKAEQEAEAKRNVRENEAAEQNKRIAKMQKEVDEKNEVVKVKKSKSKPIVSWWEKTIKEEHQKAYTKAKGVLKRRKENKIIAQARPFGQFKKKKQGKTLSRKSRIRLI
jgi:hypothetical protein